MLIGLPDPSPDACSAILCLNCGSYYCNYCFASFASQDSARNRSEAHEHAATHNELGPGEQADPFLSVELVAKGQRLHQRAKVVHFLQLLLSSREYLDTPTNGRQLASMVMVLVYEDICLLQLDPFDMWNDVLRSEGTVQQGAVALDEVSVAAVTAKSLALAIASHNLSAAEMILSSGEDIDVNYVHRVDVDGGEGVGYPLTSLAVLMGMDDLAIDLLRRGADVLIQDSRLGRTVMYVIVERAGKKLIDFVFAHFADFDWNQILTTEVCQYQALHVAARYNRGQWIERLIQRGADILAEEGEFQYDALLTAVVMDNHWTTIELIRCGADARRMSANGKCAAGVAAERGNVHVLAAFCEMNPVVVNAVVDTARDCRLLDTAISFKKRHVVRYLIDNGAELSYFCRDGQSPLMVAVLFSDEYSAIMLIEAGADLHQCVYKNRNAL